MKKLSFLIVSLLIFTGCKYDVHGDLNITDTLNLGGKTYEPGSYNAHVGIGKTIFAGRYKLKLNIQTSRGTGEYKFKAPKGTDLPKNGHFKYTAGQLNQSYGLEGDVRTEYTDGPQRRQQTACTYQVGYRVCRTDGRGRTYCHVEYRTHYGRQEIEYFLRTVDQDLTFDIMKGNNSHANFNGSYNDTYAVRTWTGHCW